MSNRILIVEDDKSFCETLEDFFEEEGFKIDKSFDGENALDMCYKVSYDIYLIDINMPFLNGFEFLKLLRESGDKTPAIFVTSANDKESLVNGFKIGCDDFVTKPIDLDELLLRVKAKINRYKPQEIFKFREFSIDFNNNHIIKGNTIFELPPKEMKLLSLFIMNPNLIITKEMIINELWSSEKEYSEGSIRVYINDIKRILGKDSIKNLRGVGYKAMWN